MSFGHNPRTYLDCGGSGKSSQRSLLFFDCHADQLIARWSFGARLGVSLRKGLKHIHPGKHLAKNRVFAVILCSWRIRNEKLASTGIWSRVDHGNHPGFIECEAWGNLGDDIIARGAFPRAARVASLREEIGNHAMKCDIVIPAVARKKNKRVNRDGRLIGKSLKDNVALLCF